MRRIISALTCVLLCGAASACNGGLAIGGVDTDAGQPEAPQSPFDAAPASDATSGLDAPSPSDATSPFDAAIDGPYEIPPQCSNPGPFALPTSATLVSQLIGTWINCDNSIFAGAGVPIDEVGVVIRPDMTWQKLGVSGGRLVLLTKHTDYGTWAAQPPSMYPGVVLSWDATGLTVNPDFAADDLSMQVTTAAGGNQAILARAPGT